MDSNGDAEGNFTVVALLDDLEMNGTIRMSMQPVGYFQYSTNGSNGHIDLPVSIFNTVLITCIFYISWSCS